MKKNSFKKSEKEYLKVAKTLIEIRPICHVISAITTVLFLIVLVLHRKEALAFIEWAGWWSYLIVGVVALVAAFWYENKLEKVIDSLGIVLAKGHSKRLALGISVIALPLIFLAGASSFVGSSEMAASSADKVFESDISEFEKRLEDNSKLFKNDKKKIEKKFEENRSQLRESIEKRYLAELKAVPAKNKAKYYKYKSSEWHLTQLNKFNALDSATISTKLAKELQAHDSETETKSREMIAEHTVQEQDNDRTGASAFEYRKKRTERKISRLDWFGNFFGIIAVLALGISVLCSLCAYYICENLDVSPTQLKKKKKMFSFSSLSPILSKRGSSTRKSYDFKQKDVVEAPLDGVGEEQSNYIDSMKAKAQQLAELRKSKDINEARAATQELASMLDLLEDNGIEVWWDSAKQEKLHFKNK